MPDENALKERIAKFLKHFALLDGDEKGEAQVFLDRFFQALGHFGGRRSRCSQAGSRNLQAG